MKRHIFILFVLIGFFPHLAKAQSLGYKNHRIAISADGNNQADKLHKWQRADPDDWGGTPAALAMIAKLKLQDKLVHYSYNNFISSPPHTTDVNEMKIGIDGAIEFWNFDKDRFFDVSENNSPAIEHLVKELEKSTEADPLYFIHMGPAEFFYRAVKLTIDNGHVENLSHVKVISHSGYNDNHLRRGDSKFDIEPVEASEKHHTMAETIALSGDRLQYTKIKDQNGGDYPDVLWKSHEDWSVWYWMRDHKDKSIQWIYERMLANSKNSADISDAGMVYYLLLGDEDGSPSKLKSFLGDGILTTMEDAPQECTDVFLTGIKDFEIAQIDTFVTPYKDTGRNAIAINAGAYKDRYAATRKVFEGASSYYNISLTTLTEEDGESNYRFSVNDVLIGEFQNPETQDDMNPFVHTFENVLVRNGDVLQIESNTHSNGKIPEGDGFAYARGRWRSISFECLNASECDVLEKEGILIFEAERFELKGGWKLGEDKDKASGGEYIYFDGPNSYQSVNNNNIISYTFQIANPGNYTVKWMVRQPDGERGTDKGNDAYIYLSDDIGYASNHQLTGYEKFYSRSGDDFILHGIAEVHDVGHSWLTARFPTAGEYTINICGRSHGLQIDRIVMYKGVTFDEMGLVVEEIKETTSCGGSIAPSTEKVGVVSFPSSIPNTQKNMSAKVSYTALENRTILCEICNANNEVVASEERTVEEGIGVETIEFSWNETLLVSNEYKLRIYLLAIGSDASENIVEVEKLLKVVDANAPADKDEVSFLEVPEQLAQDELSFQVKVAYTTTEQRDLNVEVKQDEYITSSKVTVPAGYGDTEITLNLAEKLVVGEKYTLILAVRPLNGGWQTNISKVEVEFEVVSGATAVLLKKRESMVYPNPFTESFQFENKGEIKAFSVIGIQGQTILADHAQNGLNTVAMSNVECGVYFLKIDQNNGVSRCVKLIKK